MATFICMSLIIPGRVNARWMFSSSCKSSKVKFLNKLKNEPTWLEINFHFTWWSNFSVRNSGTMKKLGGFSKMCDTPWRKETLYQETKYCGLLDFLKINIPDLTQPNDLKWYPWRPRCCKCRQTFGTPFLELYSKPIALPFEYLQRN